MLVVPNLRVHRSPERVAHHALLTRNRLVG